jgi:hypothetical protein
MMRGELEGLDRESLVIRAQAAGIRRARILTRPELIDELLRLDPMTDEGQLRRSRGFFGRARDLVARVVERGLHLPDAAERIRTLAGDLPHAVPRAEPHAMPTVTLAEIYAAQGHPKRAVETLRRVLEREPDHVAAQTLLARLEDEGYVAPPVPLPPEPEVEPELSRVEEAPEAPVEEASEAEEPDECFAIPMAPAGGGARTYVRWRVSWTAIDAQVCARPHGRFVVRVYVVRPSWDGPSAEVRDRSIDPDADELIVQGLPEPSVVRVAVGWLDGVTFIPFAHSPALELTRARGLAIWTPAGSVPVVLDDPRAVSIARALDQSRHAAEAQG